jgi:YD repeat-containing protein
VRLSYTRDEAGAVVRERISRPQATTPPEEGDLVTSFDGADRIVKSGNDSYRYDAQGNVAEITDSRSAMTFTASYDPEGRPLTIIQDGVTSTYAYNGLGQRVTAVRGGDDRYHPQRPHVFEPIQRQSAL